MDTINITKTIRTKKSNVKAVIDIARSNGYTYSRLHSDIDEALVNKEVAQEIFKILHKKRQKSNKKLVKLTDEELAIYADDNTQSPTVHTFNPRTYPSSQ